MMSGTNSSIETTESSTGVASGDSSSSSSSIASNAGISLGFRKSGLGGGDAGLDFLEVEF